MGDFEEDLHESEAAAKAVLAAMKREREAFETYDKALSRLYSKSLEYYNSHRVHLDAAELDKATKGEQEAERKADADYQAARKATRDAVDRFVEAEKHVIWHMARLGLPWPHH